MCQRQSNPRPPIGLQNSMILNAEAGFSWLLSKHVYQFSANGRHSLTQKYKKPTKIEIKNIQDLQRSEAPDLEQAQNCCGVKHVL